MSSLSGNPTEEYYYNTEDEINRLDPASSPTAALEQQQQHHNNNNNTENNSKSTSSLLSLPFFADAMLDLEEAHDIADTPEATRPHVNVIPIHRNRNKLQVPTLVLSSSSAAVAAVESASLQQSQPKPSAPNDQEILSTTNNNSSSLLEMSSTHNHHNTLSRSHSSTSKNRERRLSPVPSEDEQLSPSSPTPNNADHDDSLLLLSFSRITNVDMDIRVRKPRWPRDIPWTIGFLLWVPLSLLYPAFFITKTSPLAKHPLSFATLHAITWTILAVIILSRQLYRSVAGGDGDNARSVAASFMTNAAPLSILVYCALTLTVWWGCPTTRWAAVLPGFYTVRDLWTFRRWNRRTPQAGVGYATRVAFFQAIACMALDILSRSLRRASFYRVLTGLLSLQLGVLLLWRWALLGSISSLSCWMVAATFVGGKWATGTITRVLTLLASAGVMNWCAQQGDMLHVMHDNSTGGIYATNGRENELDNRDDDNNNKSDDNNSMPEAYRTVDASVYQSILGMDDVLDDDDYEDLEDEVVRDASGIPSTARNFSPARGGQPTAGATTGTPHPHPRRTVKDILFTGVTISFGSVAHCGLLGGLAQFVYSQVRKIEFAQRAITEARQVGGFRGMHIGERRAGMLTDITTKLLVLAREFVRNHSDLAMTHVAGYYKAYVKAARDVATVVEQSGLEPILHEDITTHMCTCVGGSITGIIVLITTYLLFHQRKRHVEVSDIHVVEDMLLSFILSYTLIFTVMEPLRAAIKASYIAFAQNPRCLSQSFPLIYHRLCRLSESSIS